MLVVTILFMNGAALGIEAMAHTMGYENRLFDNTKVHTIDIIMDDWDEFIANATSEEYYAANVVIDGEAYKNVGIRGKGNTSLSTVSSLGSERYSFKIEFDQYDSSITYHGLDKLSLNNLIQDSTMMKDYLAYTMMREFGAETPLCSFVYITVNGEDWGLYLAVEGVEDAFLERNYGSDYGELYKPDSMSFGGGRGKGKDFDMGNFDFNFDRGDTDSSETNENAGSMNPPSMFGGEFDPSSMFGGEMPDGFDSSSIPENFDPSTMFGDSEDKRFNFGGGFGMGSSDVKLQYIDDSIDSYTNIWNNAKTDITQVDQNRLIESLRKLSFGEEIESVVDLEQVIRYFVVHNYICNDDSYTGMMVHNYYLYEEDGQLTMIPWDYNLGYGTFSTSNATSTVNTPIDTPVSGGSSDRPMLNWIFENEEYTEMYHQYFAEFLNTVDIQGIINKAYNLIKSYVEKDPTAFYTYEEFEKGVETMRQFCSLRTESISMQLENGETTSNMNYVDASDITLSDMGSMSGMGGFGGGKPNTGGFEGTGSKGTNSSQMPGDSEEFGVNVEGDSLTVFGNTFQNMSGNMPSDIPEGFDPSQMPEGFDPSQMPEGFDPSQMPEGFDPSQMPEGFDPSQMPEGFSGGFPGQSSEGTETTPPANSGNSDTSDSSGSRSLFRDNMQMPGGDLNFNMNGMGTAASSSTGWIWIAVSVLVLGAGLIIAKRYKY